MRTLSTLCLCLAVLAAQAQVADSSGTPVGFSQGLGNGLNFSIDEGQYRFKISGFLQPAYLNTHEDGQRAQHYLRTKRSYLNFSGTALKEKVSFFVQANFSQSQPLLDAYGAYNPVQGLSISVGQRRTFTNNREFTFDEDKLAFTERGLLSTTFAGNGREFGLFVEGRIGKSFIIAPQAAVTSGDGPNSFGLNAADVDLGGLKYGGRLDIYPLGDFAEGNRGFAPDLRHEASPKLLIGGAGSYNRGASSARGEGHGDFRFYDADGRSHLPDYRKLSADLLLKYGGVSVLAEYQKASASGLAGIYLDSVADAPLLRPGQIAQYLVLGNARNVQAGYATRSGYALDLRYESLAPEFKSEALSQLRQAKVYTAGLSRYFKDNKLKLQATLSRIFYTDATSALRSEVVFQVVF